MANKHFIKNLRSSQLIDEGGIAKPKLPTVEQIDYGELAINYAKGHETISIKNDENEIKSFNFNSISELDVKIDGIQEQVDNLPTSETVQNEIDRAQGVEKTLSDGILSLDNTIKGLNANVEADEVDDGQYSVLTGIKQIQGKLVEDDVPQVKLAKVAKTGEAIDVIAVEISEDETHVQVTGTNVQSQIESLSSSLKTVIAEGITYEVHKLTEEELKEKEPAEYENIREAFALVPNTGGISGDIIKIYKDSTLKDADFVSEAPIGEEGAMVAGWFLKLVYILEDSTEKTVYLDMKKVLPEPKQVQVKNGIEEDSTDHKLHVKIDEANDEGYLEETENGLKVTGVKNAITEAIGSLDSSVELDEIDDENIPDEFEVMRGVVEEDGLLTEALAITLKKVAYTAKGEDVHVDPISADESHVAVTGSNVKDQIISLSKTLSDVEADGLKYIIKKVEIEDKTVKEAYQLYSYTGDFDIEKATALEGPIKIYHDETLIDAEFTKIKEEEGETTQGNYLKLTFRNAENTQYVKYLDMTEASIDLHFGDGLKAENDTVSVKLVDGNDYLKFSEGEEGKKSLEANVVSLDDAHAAAEGVDALTGLADALDVKTTIESKIADLKVDETEHISEEFSDMTNQHIKIVYSETDGKVDIKVYEKNIADVTSTPSLTDYNNFKTWAGSDGDLNGHNSLHDYVTDIDKDVDDLYDHVGTSIKNLASTDQVVSTDHLQLNYVVTDEGKLSVLLGEKDIASKSDCDECIKNVSLNNIVGSVADRIANVTIKGKDISLADTYQQTEYPIEFDSKAEHIVNTDKINESFKKVENTLKALSTEVINNELTASKSITAFAESSGLLSVNDEIVYTKKDNANYIGNAENLSDAVNILDDSLKVIEKLIDTSIKQAIRDLVASNPTLINPYE